MVSRAQPPIRGLESQVLSPAFDLFFATAVAFITEGQTKCFVRILVFAIIAAGNRRQGRVVATARFASVALYLLVNSEPGNNSVYYMRAVYLAIADI